MSNLTLRILSALTMAAVLLSAMVLDPRTRWVTAALVLALAAWEYSRMIGAKFAGPNAALLAGLAVLAFTLPHFPGLSLPRENWTWGVACLGVATFTLLGFRYVEISSLAPWIYLNLFGMAYFGIYAAGLFDLFLPFAGWRGIYPFLMIQILVSSADTGAYFSGKAFGKHKLCPTISSGKTREGALGGAILTIAVSLGLGPSLLGTGMLANAGLGVLVAGAAIVGDLFISILKRYTGVKDSSRLIPGHGGILDRFDALLFAAPFAAFYLRLVQG